MNRFRSRKKSLGESESGSRGPSQDSETPPMPAFSSKTFKRKKQAATEQSKPEIDLATALPPQDDFRTSLLMPNLSARFSMLREQDDPASKLGKANDDSVLFPKRASRLDLFNRHGLSDIAEVDSIHGSIRPPFATARTESYGTGGYDVDEGSVMVRARPGEGNTMFGGRQKIYKIPVGGSGSVKNFNAEEGDLPAGGNMGGKALYESDIAMSAFQKLREQERQERESTGLDTHGSLRDQERSGSPPLARYNRNRETSSSTNSGPSQPRTSTAATSVASQRSAYEAISGSFHAQSSTQPSSSGSDRPIQKTKRLYGQGLDQHLHEQQSLALTRLESIQRQRTVGGSPTPKDLQNSRRQSRSASNLNERYQRGGPLYPTNGYRSASPVPPGTPPRMAEFDLGFGNDQAGNTSDSGNGRSTPLSPPLSPDQDLNQDTTFVASLEPNDLGKATASGAFNRPTKQYDEQQYLRRQLQLQEGRNTPSPQLFRPFSPHAPSIDEQTTGRSRNNSLGSNFSRAESFRQPWEHHMEDRVLPSVRERGNTPSLHEQGDQKQESMERSFFAINSGSEVGSQAESESETDPSSPIPFESNVQDTPSPPLQQSKLVGSSRQLYFPPDPTHLSEPTDDASSDGRSYRSVQTITQQRDKPIAENTISQAQDTDSPTLGPVQASNDLSGLVRAHLRNNSGQSSVYPEDEDEKNRYSVQVRGSIFGHQSALNHSRQHSRDDKEPIGQHWAKGGYRSSDQSSAAAPPPLSFAARHILDQATALRNNQESFKARQMLGDDKAQRILGSEAPRSMHSKKDSNSNNDWQAQLNAHHTRALSTETQHEREALANELAERRRRVQDNLKTYVQGESRSASPSPGLRTHDNSPARAGHPFGILKKSSRGSLVTGRERSAKSQERPSKAMKMLGISSSNGPGPGSHVHPPQPLSDMFMGREQFPDRAMPARQKYPSQQKRPQDVRQHSDTPNSIPCEAGSERSRENPTQRHSPNSSKSGSAYSDKSNRPSDSHSASAMKSNLDRGRAHGYATNGVNPEPGSQTPFNPPRHKDELLASMARHGMSPGERSRSAMSGRIRSNSRTEYQRTAPPNTPFMINPSTRPPANPYPYTTHSTPSLHDGRLPSLSLQTSSTPTMITPQSAPNTSYGRHQSHRKQSINKHDISEPMFISCTSSMDTVSLPPEASLRNGMESSPSENEAPPIPVRNSRRKRTHALIQSLGRTDKSQPSPTKRNFAPSPSPREEDENEMQGTFSGDDESTSVSISLRHRLRKISSEGGNMSAKVRQHIFESRSPTGPNFPGREAQSPRMEHFPYQAQKDVPASAVMF